MHRKGPIIAFVHNIPMTMHWKGLWALFRYHGEVIDAFIPEFGRIEVGESSLRSNYDPNKKDEEVVKEKNTNIVVQGHVEEEQLWNLQRCLVGTTATCCDSKSLFERIVRSGLWEIKIRRMQGRIAGIWGQLISLGENSTMEESWREGRRIAGFSTGLGRHCCFRIEITDESRVGTESGREIRLGRRSNS
ncbi:hypothetical protein GOBAR_DD26476 [Gossypium barbadense]|nr:hypothetical protein GOBAR_DD26476 [Gossypium barbadense]